MEKVYRLNADRWDNAWSEITDGLEMYSMYSCNHRMSLAVGGNVA